MREWLKAYPDILHRLHVLIIDHQWRAESLCEAQKTQQYLQQCLPDADIHILTAHNKSGKNSEADARYMRYQTLQQYCQQHDILFLLTGHQRDDKVEVFG